jgi:hypothetical protein
MAVTVPSRSSTKPAPAGYARRFYVLPLAAGEPVIFEPSFAFESYEEAMADAEAEGWQAFSILLTHVREV